MREMRRVGLLDALDYCALLAVERSERFEPAGSLEGGEGEQVHGYVYVISAVHRGVQDGLSGHASG
jgi:hypothetical protein